MMVAPYSGFTQMPDVKPDREIDAASRTQIINDLLARLNKSYVFPEVAGRMERAIRERIARGEYAEVTSAARLSKKLTDDLREVSRDKHLGVFYSAQPLPVREEGQRTPSGDERAQMEQFARKLNFGFERVERLQGNIGYLDVRGFMPAELSGDTVAAAMNFIANTDALIIDLRQNGGGEPAGVALLCSYLFGAEPIHLNDLYWREGNRTEQFWTLANVPGKRYTGKPVYVLTSNKTFSGGEEFVYNLKNLKRATLIGETTGGGAHPGGVFRLTEHFGVFVPTGRAINPITKTNWEGTASHLMSTCLPHKRCKLHTSRQRKSY
jgi:hypothetical protein